jgi:hypothetical protein
VTENHGGEKRVMRVRCSMRLSRLSSFVLRCYAGATAVALVVGLPVPAFIIAAAGLANFAYIADQTWRFGKIMNRVIDEVASKVKLLPMAGRKAG